MPKFQAQDISWCFFGHRGCHLPLRGLDEMTSAIHDLCRTANWYGALKSSPSPHRFLSTQVGSAIISSEVWDETGEVSTAVTFHLQHQTQVLGVLLGTTTTGTLILIWSSHTPIFVHLNQNLKMFKKNNSQAIPLFSRTLQCAHKSGNSLNVHQEGMAQKAMWGYTVEQSAEVI